MNKHIPTYDFNRNQNLDFEYTTIQSIFKKSKRQLAKPHRQGFFGLFYFTTSGGNHVIDFHAYTIHRGDLFFISEEQVHYFQDIENARAEVILFTGLFLDNDELLAEVFEQNIGNPVLNANSFIIDLFRWTQMNFQEEKKGKRQVLQNFLEIILLEIIHKKESITLSKDHVFQRFITFKKLLKNNVEKEKSVHYYANQLGVTTKTLNLTVRKIVGQSAKQYINNYVVLLAKRMLVNSSLTSTEIAYTLGFDEPTNFTKFFKHIEGVSPMAFKKKTILI